LKEGVTELKIELSVIVDVSSLVLDDSPPDSEVEGISVLDTVEDEICGVVTTELLSTTLEDRLGWRVGPTSVEDSPLEDDTPMLEVPDGIPVFKGMEVLSGAVPE
jgi:hypothetical protein